MQMEEPSPHGQVNGERWDYNIHPDDHGPQHGKDHTLLTWWSTLTCSWYEEGRCLIGSVMLQRCRLRTCEGVCHMGFGMKG